MCLEPSPGDPLVMRCRTDAGKVWAPSRDLRQEVLRSDVTVHKQMLVVRRKVWDLEAKNQSKKNKELEKCNGAWGTYVGVYAI